MAYSTPYDYNEESVRQLDEKFSEIEHDRFLYCIQDQQKWDIEKVNNFIAQLRTSHTFTLKELDRLKILEPTYNKEYSTNHRRYITTAQEVVSKMTSTLSGFKKIVAEFRNKGKNKKEVTMENGKKKSRWSFLGDIVIAGAGAIADSVVSAAEKGAKQSGREQEFREKKAQFDEQRNQTRQAFTKMTGKK